MELGSNEAIKEAILAGLGVAILARYSIGLDLNPQELAVLDIEGFPIELNWNFVYPAGKHLSPIARAFVEMVNREAKSPACCPDRCGRQASGEAIQESRIHSSFDRAGIR